MNGELLLTILSSVAQQEVENNSAHVKKDWKWKWKKGSLLVFKVVLAMIMTLQKSISIKEEINDNTLVKYLKKLEN